MSVITQKAQNSDNFDRFRIWANEFRTSQLDRLRLEGKSKLGGASWWWSRLDHDLQSVLLHRASGGDLDAQRFVGGEWAIVPDAMRAKVSIESRAMHRVLEGCPWR